MTKNDGGPAMKTYLIQIRHPDSTPLDRRWAYIEVDTDDIDQEIRGHCLLACIFGDAENERQARQLIGEVREVE